MTFRRNHMVLVLALTLGASACDGPGVVDPRRPFQLAGEGNTATASIVGTWRRTVFFVDDFGIPRSAETTWQFNADGGASRTLITRNLALGLADVQLFVGQYRLSNTQVIVDFTSPSPTQVQYAVRMTGDQLELAGEPYLRVVN